MSLTNYGRKFYCYFMDYMDSFLNEFSFSKFLSAVPNTVYKKIKAYLGLSALSNRYLNIFK